MNCVFIKSNMVLFCLLAIFCTGLSWNADAKPSYYQYTIKKNNTPKDVSKIFGISLNDLKKHNPSMDRRWLYGIKITIPISASSVKKYTVTRGDSLYSIAKKFQIPVSYLEKTLDEKFQKNLWVGATIDIPPTAKITPSAPTPKPPAPAPKPQKAGPKPSLYTVKKGDTYYSLAKKSDIDIKTLQDLNSNKPLLIGSRIVLPPPTSTTQGSSSSPVTLKAFSGKLMAPYRSSPSNYSSLAPGVTYTITKTHGQNIRSPLVGTIDQIQPFLGFGTGIFLSNGDTTVILASKGFSSFLVAKGKTVNAGVTLAKVKYGYKVYLFRMKNGAIVSPF